MCIRDSDHFVTETDRALDLLGTILPEARFLDDGETLTYFCLLYTSDAADERSSVDLGGRRIIKKKKLEKAAG